MSVNIMVVLEIMGFSVFLRGLVSAGVGSLQPPGGPPNKNILNVKERKLLIPDRLVLIRSLSGGRGRWLSGGLSGAYPGFSSCPGACPAARYRG